MDYIYFLISLTDFILVLRWDVNGDFKKWLDEKNINHNHESWIRLMLLTPAITFFTIAQHPINFWWMLLYLFLTCLFIASQYWFWFDGLLANKKHYNWFYKGTKDEHDSVTESFSHRLKKWQYITLKVLSCLLLTILYFVLWK
jgi:hypothetical protein